METPQLENGYIKIANEIWKELGHYRISGEEWLILNCVLAKTYGWNKKEDAISISQFNEWTGLKKPNVVRAIKKLIIKNIVIKKDTGKINLFRFNKLFNTWTPSIKKDTAVSKKITPSIKKDNKPVSKKIHTKDIPKDIITKDILLRNSETFGNPEINELIEYFKQVMQIPKEDCTQKQSRQYWHLLLKESKTGIQGVKWLVDIAKADDFYSNNITSSKSLYYSRIKLITRQRGNKPKIAVFGGGNNE